MLALMESNDQFGIFAEQGTGKTLPVLFHLDNLLKSNEIEKAIVVAPKATLRGWIRQMELLEPDQTKRLKESVTVINYDLVWRRPELLEEDWGAVVLDESHYIKSRSSKRTQFCIELGYKAKYRYILTGTPIANSKLEEIWAQFTFLAPEKRPRLRHMASQWLGSWKEFTDKYCVLDRYWNPYKYMNVAELQDIISENSYRVLKEDCLELPDKLPDEAYDVELKEKALYKKLHKDAVIEEFEMIAENPLAKMLRLRQICSGFVSDDSSTVHPKKTEKIKVLDEYLDGRDGKTVIFCEFRYSIDRVSELLNKRKMKFVTLDGRQADKGIWQRFQEEDDVEVIICQYQSGNAGIDLYAADTIVFYEPTLSSTVLSQAKDRIHRIGQTKKCSYIHLITEGTIEEKIYESLLKYEDFGKRLFEEYLEDFQKSYGVQKGGKRN